MPKSPVTVSIENNIALVTLNKAEKRNALDIPMFKALDKVSKELKQNRAIRAVIVNAKGEDFCSGLDIKSVLSNKSSALSLLFKWLPGQANLAQRVSYNWRKIPVPVIMAIHGRCWGGGLQIALGADFRIAHEQASFSVMEGKWGLIPDMAGNLVLREILAKDIALKLTMTAEIISAKQALNYGLITELSDEPLQSAYDLAKQVSERSPDSVAAVKKLFHNNWFKADWVMLAKESYYQIKILLTKNQKIAVKKQLKPEQAPDYTKRNNW
ncbi:crotonase/enoyl-CoA hydratase family protein [Thalassomonas sp. M1454]|uniref:crotonase/enoyl-CoA hydratase family protein n=1 Tax=Thalassomonas sp. M1454 TaxID=2594477 RepID=UPI00117F3BFC|nr:crotonase/enoyl-CoA hydratase family protein [Thalassomonas sp. M1454]TRX55878.1 crotonase/enoyl-CoA hydratase family protein [Thalassomonas sp. M1454]